MPEALRVASLPILAAYVAAFFGLLTVVSVAFGLAAERLVSGRRIFAVPLPEGQLRFELLGNLVFLAVTVTTFTAALWLGVARLGETTWTSGALTFVALMFGFQVFYYFLHRLMHTRPLLFTHRWHHRSQITTPLSAQSMSVFEAAAWMLGYVGLPVAMSWLVPVSFWGWAAYIAFNVSTNIVGHANVELASGPAASRAATYFANPWIYHSLHHARWTGHYSFQAALMDRIGGTEWKDWPELYARVVASKPLESLKVRGAGE